MRAREYIRSLRSPVFMGAIQISILLYFTLLYFTLLYLKSITKFIAEAPVSIYFNLSRFLLHFGDVFFCLYRRASRVTSRFTATHPYVRCAKPRVVHAILRSQNASLMSNWAFRIPQWHLQNGISLFLMFVCLFKCLLLLALCRLSWCRLFKCLNVMLYVVF